jgi:hypothetical protein
VKWQALKTVARDTLLYIWGFGGIAYQQLTGQVNPWLLGVYVTMLGIPGGIAAGQLLLLLRGNGKPTIPDTPGESSSSPSSSRQSF